MKRLFLASSVLFGIAFSTPSHADNWPQFRGPNMNGSSSEQSLPDKLDPDKNLKWKADLPGYAGSTPAVWENHIFLSSTERKGESGSLVAMCINRETGKEMWRHKVADVYEQADGQTSYANPSPATDGERAVFFFGNGDLVCYDFEGTELWRRNLCQEYGHFAFLWTFSTSPLIHEDKLIMQVLQRDTPVRGRGFTDKPNESYLLCLNVKDGKEVWKVNRPSKAVAESRESFTTPIIHEHGGTTELIVAGGDCLTGHDPATGAERWRWGTWNPERIGHWRLVPSPLAAEGVVLLCAPKREPVYAVPLGKTGAISKEDLAWVSESKDVSSDVSSPVYYQGRIYILHSDRRSLACIKPATGEVVWTAREDLESRSKFEASPTAADGKIYLLNHSGEAFVVATGDEFKLLNKVSLGNPRNKKANNRSTVAVAQGNVLVRTEDALYCFGS